MGLYNSIGANTFLPNGVEVQGPATSQIRFSDGTNTITIDLDDSTNGTMSITNNQNKHFDFTEAVRFRGTSATPSSGGGASIGYDGTQGFIDVVDRTSGFLAQKLFVNNAQETRVLFEEILSASLGLIMTDEEGTPHRWRMTIDGSGAGAFAFEDLGAA